MDHEDNPSILIVGNLGILIMIHAYVHTMGRLCIGTITLDLSNDAAFTHGSQLHAV